MNDREGEGGSSMNRDRPQPSLSIEPETRGNTEDRSDQRGRHVPQRQVEEDQRAELDPVDVRFGVQGGEAIGLAGGKESEQRGDKEHPSNRRSPHFWHRPNIR